MMKIALGLMFCVPYFASAQIQYPMIEFTYDWRGIALDFFGSIFFDSPTKDLKEKLDHYLPQFVRGWERDAPILFGELAAVYHKGINAPSRTGVLYLSHNSSYGSHQFLIFGLRYLLDSSWDCAISREEVFSTTVFHELLHIWVDENICQNQSRLLQKYKKEDSLVLDHLHLMAIQKMIYLKINRRDLLDLIDESYRTYQGPLYKRAWEIVNDLEGYESVLADIVLN